MICHVTHDVSAAHGVGAGGQGEVTPVVLDVVTSVSVVVVIFG